MAHKLLLQLRYGAGIHSFVLRSVGNDGLDRLVIGAERVFLEIIDQTQQLIRQARLFRRSVVQ